MTDREPFGFYESKSEDRTMLWFESAGTVGTRLARCEHPIDVPADRHNPTGVGQCYNHAVAKIEWSNDTEMKVCKEHYDEIREDIKQAARRSGGPVREP